LDHSEELPNALQPVCQTRKTAEFRHFFDLRAEQFCSSIRKIGNFHQYLEVAESDCLLRWPPAALTAIAAARLSPDTDRNLTAMALRHISLSAFRNHAETTLTETAQLNLLIGANGAGKTNILEALSLLAPGRGLRRAAMTDMAQAGGQNGFTVAASLTSEAQASEARLGTYTTGDQPSRRKVRINTAEASAIAMGEWLAVGWLTPAMDGLFTGPAGERRRYMDRLALALDPEHARHSSRYETALRERNRLLTAEDAPDPLWLSGIEAQMAEHGAKLAAGRARLVDAMMAEIVCAPEAPFPRPALTYAPQTPPGSASEVNGIIGAVTADWLSQAWHDSRAADRAAGRTLIGPHRDDLEVSYAAKRTPAAMCSTGEQKALLLAMTLAHTALAEKGRASILLLDEVAAHLDPDRRIALFERLRASRAQVWMTGTELAPFSAIADEAAIWEVQEGAVKAL
jgi:DNA replication and repair protein RecF